MSDRLSFTTRASAPCDRAKVWRRHLESVYCNMDLQTKDDVIDGEIVLRSFGSIGFSRVGVSASRVNRRRESAFADKIERFCFVFPTQSTFEHSQHGIQNKTSPGSVFVVNLAEPYQVDHAGYGSNICLTVPSELIRDRVHQIDDLCSRSNFADVVIASTLRHLVQETLRHGSQADVDRFELLCAEMLESMLRSSSRARSFFLPKGGIGTLGLFS